MLQKNDVSLTLTSAVSNRSSHAINLRSPTARHSMPITVPPFRPIHPGDNKHLNRPTRITKYREDDPVTVVAVPAFAALPQSIAKVPTYSNRHVDPQGLQKLMSDSNYYNNRRVSVSAIITSKEVDCHALFSESLIHRK